MNPIYKKDGFVGQKSVVLPLSVINEVEQNNMINQLYITDIGYYPKARYHHRERKSGIDQYILIFVVEGKGWVRMMKRKFNLHTGQFLIIPADEPHLYEADLKNPWSIYWVHFKGTKASDLYSRFRPRTGSWGMVQLQIDARVQTFEEILSVLSYGYGEDNLEYVNMCLWYLLSGFIYGDFLLNLKIPEIRDPVRESIQFMKENLNADLTLTEISDKFGYSVSHFTKLFTRRTGHSPIKYFIYMKIQKACEMLDFTELKVKEIARELAFSDPYYFSRVFSKVMNLSPSQYRERRI